MLACEKLLTSNFSCPFQPHCFKFYLNSSKGCVKNGAYDIIGKISGECNETDRDNRPGKDRVWFQVRKKTAGKQHKNGLENIKGKKGYERLGARISKFTTPNGISPPCYRDLR
jgi:hypothetical protein